jgi:hypothetical protein
VNQGIVYHAYYRPLTTPAAALLDLSAAIHRKIPPNVPSPSSILKSLGSIYATPPSSHIGSSLDSIANALAIPPIHVDHVADAICVTLTDNNIRGVVDVHRMRAMLGLGEDETSGQAAAGYI